MWFLPNTDIEDRLIMQAHLFDSDVRDSIRAFKVHRFPDCAAVRSDNHLEVILPIIRHKVAASPQWQDAESIRYIRFSHVQKDSELRPIALFCYQDSEEDCIPVTRLGGSADRPNGLCEGDHPPDG